MMLPSKTVLIRLSVPSSQERVALRTSAAELATQQSQLDVDRNAVALALRQIE